MRTVTRCGLGVWESGWCGSICKRGTETRRCDGEGANRLWARGRLPQADSPIPQQVGRAGILAELATPAVPGYDACRRCERPVFAGREFSPGGAAQERIFNE
jgi:hypothetical protein